MAYLNSLAERFRSQNLKIRTVTLQGDADVTLLGYARTGDITLIALTTHGHGGLKRGILGSVARFILKESDIPVLIVKPRGEKSSNK
jgi:nucleotide-binding universal stress UspA family protein